ncbi:MAG: SpoIVB peptidase [Oscillospiraceae bacterium]|nr:SpoIVB peptidase [Oscillospiraceae bacterium]
MDESKKTKRRRRVAGTVSEFFAATLIFTAAVPARAFERQEQRMLIPVGKAVGVKLFSEGVMVVALSEEESAAKKSGVKVGDILLAMNGQEIESIEQLTELVQENGDSAACLTLQRSGRTKELELIPRQDAEGVYRLGAWIRDSMAGIGTVTYVDPKNGAFAALGHAVTDVDTGKVMPLAHGAIMPAAVKAVKRGASSAPGELRGDFDLTKDLGSLYKNTPSGIFGTMDHAAATESFGEALPIAEKDEIATGAATILANCDGNEVQEYHVEIEKIYAGNQPTRNLLLRVTDERLLALTGGIVQGMSGSPILQNGRIVGAVTHVLVNDPTRGYGIFIENMLEAAE